jgi:hypothetical protein
MYFTRAEIFRWYAMECIHMAQYSDPANLARLVDLAHKWRDLAEKVEGAPDDRTSLRDVHN